MLTITSFYGIWRGSGMLGNDDTKTSKTYFDTTTKEMAFYVYFDAFILHRESIPLGCPSSLTTNGKKNSHFLAFCFMSSCYIKIKSQRTLWIFSKAPLKAVGTFQNFWFVHIIR